MDNELTEQIIGRLAPDGFVEPAEAEKKYPSRQLDTKSLVTRVAPSPTGFVHIGTIYASLINELLAHQSGGVFYLRIEDTDKKREVAGGVELIDEALKSFDIAVDEGPGVGGEYGPYVQSERSKLYLGYAIELLRKGRAYPCFATSEQLEDIRNRQMAQKVRPGYYGKFALWRGRSEADVADALAQAQPFVLRLKSLGDHLKRLDFDDALKGRVNMAENDLDVPLIKSDGLPTYHLAHVVDDHLMRTNLVIRGEEWLPSTPLHIELAQALGFEPFRYAHMAVISILDNGSKRKLSKRKDEEADIRKWLDKGYPTEAIIDYLMRLIDSGFESWRQSNPKAPYHEFPLRLAKLAASRSPLLDMAKVDDVSREAIAQMEQSDFEQQLMEWAELHDHQLATVFAQDPQYTHKVLSIERGGERPRKDLATWAEAKESYGYFFDELYNQDFSKNINSELADIRPADQKAAAQAFVDTFDPNDNSTTWLSKFRSAAQKAGYSPDTKSYEQNPDKFKGALADFAKVIRVALSGKNRTPDLYLVMQVMGSERVIRRLEKAIGY